MIRIVLQEELQRFEGHLALPAPGQIVRFSGQEDWRVRLASIEADLARDPARLLCLVSLEVARHIRRCCPLLRRGLLLEESRLRVSHVAGHLPASALLNRSMILLPFGIIPQRIGQIEALFGDRVFIRPNSALKEFAGTAVVTTELIRELDALAQIHRIDPGLEVVIDRARDLPPEEYRAWILEDRLVSLTGYSHDPDHRPSPAPQSIRDLAERLAPHIEMISGPAVADFVLDEIGQPRLIELNAISTSGIYAGTEFDRILPALAQILVPSGSA